MNRLLLTLAATAVIAPLASANAGSIFSDTFSSGSTLNGANFTPTASSTSYQYLSSKSDSVTPALSPGSLTYGIVSTSSGSCEVQALFPSYTMSVGDSLTMQVVFTDTAGILTGNGQFGIGMYNSGGSAPISGGLDAGMNSSTTLSGGTLGWQGYVGQMSYSGYADNRIMDRQAQTGTFTRDQDLIASGSSSASYHDPSGGTVGGSGAASTLSLTPGSQYTALLTYTLTAADSMDISSAIYDSSDSLLASVKGTGITPLATTFNGLGIGWIERGSEATTINIGSINITASAVPEPTSMAILGLGALGMIMYRRQRRQA